MQTRRSARLRAKASKKQLQEESKLPSEDVLSSENKKIDQFHHESGENSGNEEDGMYSVTELVSLARNSLLDTFRPHHGYDTVDSLAEKEPDIAPKGPPRVSDGFISLEDTGDDQPLKTKSKKRKNLTQSPPGLQPNLGEEGPLVFDGYSGSSRTKTKIWQNEELMKKSVLTDDFEQKPNAPVEPNKYQKAKMKKLARERTAGEGWFHLPATPLTPELRNDLKLLRMRGALDPKQHYKKNDSKDLPKYFQVGRVIGGPAEFYSSRIPRKQQRNTIVEELLADEKFKMYQKRKYAELQVKFSKNRRYKKLKKGRKFRR